MEHIRNLVFEGGGVKGIAYCGALRALKEQGILDNCTRFAGTSAGAISAWLCAYFKNNIGQIEKIQRKTDFKAFADDDLGIIRDSRRLISRYGWHKGDGFYEWAQEVTKKRFKHHHITFKQLYEETGNELVVVGCNASKGASVNFSKDSTPELYVERALRISMSIPIYYRAIFIPDKSVDESGSIRGNPNIDKEVDKGRDVFVDGGVLDNFPIQIFDSAPYPLNPVPGEIIEDVPGRTPSAYNKSTLGFRVDSQTELNLGRLKKNMDEYKASTFFQYLLGLTDLIHQMASKRHLDDHDWHRTIRINTLDVKATDFKLSPEIQDELIQKGIEATRKYIDEYSNENLNFV